MTAPAAYRRTLSKSDFKLARTCDAKLHFRENRYRDQNQLDEYLRLLRDGGYMVEALAQAKRPHGILCEYGPDVAADSAQTLELLQRENVTLFQATLLWGRRMARFDILEKKGSTIRLLEVKAKSIDSVEHAASHAAGGRGILRGKRKPYPVSSDWVEKIEEVAFQSLVLSRVMPHVTVESWLVLVDKTKRSKVDNVPGLFHLGRSYSRYIGTDEQLADLDLLAEVDISEEVAMLRDDVDEAAARYEEMLDADWDPALSAHSADCNKCEFKLEDDDPSSGYAKCWGSLAFVKPHVLELGRVGTCRHTSGEPLVEALFRSGSASLFDVPEESLCKRDGTIGPQAAQQLRQIRHTRTGECWIGPNLRGNVDRITFPLHFIDFEASRLALPYHAKMRPYGQVAFQWSCHTVSAPGATPVHTEWLNRTEVWPNSAFVRSLRDVIGDSATVVTWSAFEGSTLKEIDRELKHFEAVDPELVSWIDNLVRNRIVDLHDWARDDFYHPGMRGRTSIKVVMDALWKADGAMRDQFTGWTGMPCTESEDPYQALPPLVINGKRQDVREGTGAIRAYEAMMYGVEKDDDAAKDAWCTLLKQYCKLDTLSMVLIFEHWRRITRV